MGLPVPLGQSSRSTCCHPCLYLGIPRCALCTQHKSPHRPRLQCSVLHRRAEDLLPTMGFLRVFDHRSLSQGCACGGHLQRCADWACEPNLCVDSGTPLSELSGSTTSCCQMSKSVGLLSRLRLGGDFSLSGTRCSECSVRPNDSARASRRVFRMFRWLPTLAWAPWWT